MQAKIGNSLLPRLQPEAKPYEVNDTEIRGFLARVQPSGTISYYCSYRTTDGRRNRVLLGRHPAVTAAQARDRAKRALASVFMKEDPAKQRKDASRQTLGEFLGEDYGPWVVAHRADGQGTLNRIRACFESFKNVKLAEITPLSIERWRTQRRNNGRAATTVNRDLVSLRAALSKAVEWGRISNNPLAPVKRLKVDDHGKVRFLFEDEEARLRQALDSREERMRCERDGANAWRHQREYPLLPDLRLRYFADHLKPMVIVSVNTGIRQGELFHLRWQDVDLDRANLTIAGSSAKSGKTRYVPLNDEALQALKEWKEQSAESELVFPNAAGKPFDNVASAWGNLLNSATIEHFRWHDMRHHFASRLVMAGVDLNTVRELLGHSDIKMTLRYAHLAPEHKAAAVAKLLRK